MEKSYIEYICKICNKKYSSYQSLWIHNKKFHNNCVEIKIQKLKNVENIKKNVEKIENINKSLICEFCNKIFNSRSAKSHHKKICILKTNEIEKLKNELIKQKKENELLKNNKKIINNNSNNTNITNNNTINNGTINNITINSIGNESITHLTDEEIKTIVENNNNMSDIIKYLNFNKRLPQNHVFCISSLEGDYATYYNDKTKQIEKINKKVLFDKLVVNSFEKLNNIMLYLEISKDIKEIINEEKIESIINKHEENKLNFFANKNYKKNYDYNINELGYNNKNLIMDTWSKLPRDISEEIKEIEKLKYNSSNKTFILKDDIILKKINDQPVLFFIDSEIN